MRKLKLEIEGKNYTLEMNRNSIKWLEANGFNIEYFNKKPVTYFELLWTSLFIVNHKNVNTDELLELYEQNHSIANVIKFAVEEYSSFMNALADISSQKNEKLEIIEI